MRIETGLEAKNWSRPRASGLGLGLETLWPRPRGFCLVLETFWPLPHVIAAFGARHLNSPNNFCATSPTLTPTLSTTLLRLNWQNSIATFQCCSPCQLFYIPARSAPVERVFSQSGLQLAGHAWSIKRNGKLWKQDCGARAATNRAANRGPHCIQHQ